MNGDVTGEAHGETRVETARDAGGEAPCYAAMFETPDDLASAEDLERVAADLRMLVAGDDLLRDRLGTQPGAGIATAVDDAVAAWGGWLFGPGDAPSGFPVPAGLGAQDTDALRRWHTLCVEAIELNFAGPRAQRLAREIRKAL